MSREDMIMLIEAVEAINRLEDIVLDLTDGYPIANDRFQGIFNVYDVLYNNSRYVNMESDYDRDFDPEEEFRAIINAINKTPEEKYELITRD